MKKDLLDVFEVICHIVLKDDIEKVLNDYIYTISDEYIVKNIQMDIMKIFKNNGLENYIITLDKKNYKLSDIDIIIDNYTSTVNIKPIFIEL